MIYIKERNESKIHFIGILKALLEGKEYFNDDLDQKIIDRFIADSKNPQNKNWLANWLDIM